MPTTAGSYRTEASGADTLCSWLRTGHGRRYRLDLNQAYLAQSQVFIGIYWQRYGWVAPGEQISGLEDEWKMSAGMPRLLYVKGPAPDREPRLAAMLNEIRDNGGSS